MKILASVASNLIACAINSDPQLMIFFLVPTFTAVITTQTRMELTEREHLQVAWTTSGGNVKHVSQGPLHLPPLWIQKPDS